VTNSPWPLGRVLATARVERGLATREAARRAGISDTLWRTLERGYELRKNVQFPASPKPETVVKAAVAVGLDKKRALELAGLPTVDSDSYTEPDLSGVSDEHLLDEVRRRMQKRDGRRSLSREEIAAEPDRFEPVGPETTSPRVSRRADAT
jgi:transcriptional regulator with XRE-family HTH domain